MALRLISLGNLYRPLSTFKNTRFSNVKNISTTKTELNKAALISKIPGEKGLFSLKVLKKNYEILPLFFIVGGGIMVLSLYILYIATTRDDVRLAGELPYEDKDLKNLRKRKFLIFNQNYDTVDELKNIYKDMYSEKKE